MMCKDCLMHSCAKLFIKERKLQSQRRLCLRLLVNYCEMPDNQMKMLDPAVQPFTLKKQTVNEN